MSIYSHYLQNSSLKLADDMINRIANLGFNKVDVKFGKPLIFSWFVFEHFPYLINYNAVLNNRILFPIYNSKKNITSKLISKVFKIENSLLDIIGFCKVDYFMACNSKNYFKINIIDLKCNKDLYLDVSDIYSSNFVDIS